MRDTIYRDEAIGAVAHEYGAKHIRSVGETVADILQALKTLPSAENSNAKTQNSNQETQKSNCDLIYRADAIEAVCGVVIDEFDVSPTRGYEVAEKALSALPSAGPQTGELISREEPTVIRSRTFMPTKDFKEWAERIRDVNPNAVVIPCDAEVVSAEAVPTHGRLIDADALKENMRIAVVKHICTNTLYNTIMAVIDGSPTVQADRPHGEWTPVTEQLPKIDETLRLCDQISDEVLGTDTYGNIRHVYLTNCGYLKPTFCTVEEGVSVDIVAWMPTPEPYEEVSR